ncbi:unnamed protein product [Pleuronectes platessa]|uniref:Uncharacterized protein n=1 Tax=Pleuronectes platessa TaxID=8262 RepID=A0A9N7YVN4_PLEPL|nr:unnamed protein product [Pleuronectes platessa]
MPTSDKHQISTKEHIYPTVSIRFPFPNAQLARQETGNGVEAITLGESPRAPRNEGQGPLLSQSRGLPHTLILPSSPSLRLALSHFAPPRLATFAPSTHISFIPFSPLTPYVPLSIYAPPSTATAATTSHPPPWLVQRWKPEASSSLNDESIGHF